MIKIITASTLFAQADPTGEHNCYYCGAECDETHKTKEYVKPTFTNRDIVKFPASEYVCDGCALSLGDGWEDMQMIDGSTKEFTSPRGMAPRMYSWVLTKDKRLGFTKAHISTIREILTNKNKLPEPPFSIIISDSGQKQLIFRAPVAWEKGAFSILLEDEVINVDVELLKERLALAASISTKIGKPALKDITFNTYIQARKEGLVKEVEQWEKIMMEPLSRLAAWISPAKEKKGGANATEAKACL